MKRSCSASLGGNHQLHTEIGFLQSGESLLVQNLASVIRMGSVALCVCVVCGVVRSGYWSRKIMIITPDDGIIIAKMPSPLVDTSGPKMLAAQSHQLRGFCLSWRPLHLLQEHTISWTVHLQWWIHRKVTSLTPWPDWKWPWGLHVESVEAGFILFYLVTASLPNSFLNRAQYPSCWKTTEVLLKIATQFPTFYSLPERMFRGSPSQW